jgi:hypothetical protein
MPTEGFTSKLSISTSTTFSVQYEFLASSLKLTQSPQNAAGLQGTRSHLSERTRYGVKSVSGSISMQPTATELAGLLPWIYGANASGTSYPLSDSLTSRYVALETASGIKWQRFKDVYVARATFSASEGSPLSLSLDLVGSDEELQTAGTFPSVTADADAPFMFFDASGAFTVAATAYSIKSFQLVIDNALDVKFFNSQTATSIMPRDRVITLSTVAELVSANRTALVEGADTSAAAAITFTNGAQSLAFSMAALRATKDTPTINGRSETVINYSGQAMKTGSTLELVTTLDDT